LQKRVQHPILVNYQKRSPEKKKENVEFGGGHSGVGQRDSYASFTISLKEDELNTCRYLGAKVMGVGK